MRTIIKTFVAACSLLGVMSGCSEKEDIVFEIEKPQFQTRDNAILLEVIPPLGTKADDNIYIVGDFNGGAEAAVGNLMWLCEKASGADKWGIYLSPSDFVNGKTLADGFYFVSEKEGTERSIKNQDVNHTLNVSVGAHVNVTVDRWASYFISGDDPVVEHDGHVVYVLNETSWGDAITLYMYGDKELAGGWPGMVFTGKQKIDGVTYTYFDLGKANTGLAENLIFSNNGTAQLADFAFTIDRDVYLKLTDEGVAEFDPAEQPVEHDGYVVYVVNETSWGDALTLYMWGDAEVAGGWPGMTPSGKQKINGVTYTYFDLGEANTGLGENLIFSNNGSAQLKDYFFTIDSDIFLKITDNGVSVFDPDAPEGGEDTPSGDESDEEDGDEGDQPVVEPDNTNYVVYVLNETGWDALAMYMWGDKNDLNGSWPGMQPTGTMEIDGQNYVYFEFGVGNAGLGENLIFNNNDGGLQLDNYYITINRNYYLKVTAEGVIDLQAE